MNDNEDRKDKLSSRDLAELIMDSVIRAGIMKEEHFELSVEIAIEENDE